MAYSYDRRRFARRLDLNDVRTPLYGHDSESSAYLIEDYPYGSLRTQMRVWLEDGGKKGWRHVTQTLNPKTQRWNKPKKSTYSEWGGNLYLDGRGHVQYAGVGPYNDVDDFVTFVKKFPKTNMRMIKLVVPAFIKKLEGFLSGKLRMTINGVPKEPSELEMQEYREDLAKWQDLAKYVH